MDLTGSNSLSAVGISSHEESDHLGGIDWAGGSSAESASFAGSELILTDDGGIRLCSACRSRAITGSSVSDYKERQLR